jgi:FAD/FMN-containing dehydrogenase
MAVKVGAGLQTGEYFNLMADNNIAMVAPGPNTVGVGGGWVGNGGHGNLAAYYGLGSDQMLSAQVVTADGRFVTADSETNADIFFAIRGGGAGKQSNS